ncbi:hypothetical protein ACRRTK_012196 [Alexandromys fortis]
MTSSSSSTVNQGQWHLFNQEGTVAKKRCLPLNSRRNISFLVLQGERKSWLGQSTAVVPNSLLRTSSRIRILDEDRNHVERMNDEWRDGHQSFV